MGKPFRIEVLHIVNPHVIFVESEVQRGVPVIVQVGIHGILPVNKTVDINGQVVAERCDNWPVGVNTILREFFADHNNEIYFIPIQVEKRSTIFNEDTLQFGDIIVKARKRISVTDHLLKLSVADKDESVFQQKLASGNLIKLNAIRAEEVFNAIKMYYKKQKKVEHDWQKTIDKQTYLYQESKRVSLELTEKNLRLFERNSNPMKNVMDTIKQKEKDFNLCKDADIVGVGCGSRRCRPSRPNSTSHKKSLAHEENDDFKPHNVLNDMKNLLETHGKFKDKSNYDDFKHVSKVIGVDQSTPVKESHLHEKTAKTTNKHEFQVKYNSDEHHDRSRPKVHLRDEHTERFHQKYVRKDEKMPDLKYNSIDEDQNPPQQKIYGSQKKHYENSHKEICSHDENQNIAPEKHFGENKLHQKQSQQNESWDGPHEKYNQDCDYDEQQRINPNYRGSRETIKKATSPQKPRERLRVFCPDMEMSTDNLKNLVPTKVIEEFATDYSEEAPTQVKDDENSNLEVDHSIETKVDTKTIKHDRLKRLVSKNSCDRTDSKKITTNYDNIRDDKETRSQKTDSIIQNTSSTNTDHRLVSSNLRKKLQALKVQKQLANYSLSSNSDTSVKDTSSSTTGMSKTVELSNIEIKQLKTEQEQPKLAQNITKIERNVNPFKNLDGSKSVFVEKLVAPILMVHTKNDNFILPQCELRDIPFKSDIHCILKSMRVYKPKRLQSVSWSYILRGHSVFMISAAGNGKTLGYVPAVCNIVIDSMKDVAGVGPFCVIVCATALSVSEVEAHCKRFLSLEERIVTCFPGIDSADITMSLLNGCHVFICTAPMLVSLLEVDFGVDLRRLMVLVFDDCERLSEVYSSELNKILQHVKAMLKNRSDKSLKVQYVVASRQWCDFMTPLAKKAPDTVIAIGASQECVLYSKTKTSVNFVMNRDSKVNTVLEFLQEIDSSKRTVITCRDDDEVVLLESILKKMKHTVFACNSTMTLHDLYQLNEVWANYQEPVLGPILICCDGNLTHLNITNANYLVHFSMPALFSMFCKRFSVLNENYTSIFGEESENVKIKILLDETNVEQLPKILHFIKRCTKQSFPMLDNILQEVLINKDLKKAEIMVPICNTLLMLGECIDTCHCPDRHTVFKQWDNPKDWVPRLGVITFKIKHVDTAVAYSARVLSTITKSGTTKYTNNYNTLSLKMGMYYSKEVNRKLHGTPKLGDICAVAAKQNFFERCQVMKILPNDSGKSVHVLINLIDEEKLTITKDVHLYYLPDEFKAVDTHMVNIRLANIQPKDKDVTFSVAANNQIRSIVEHDTENVLYVRGRIVMTLGNTIFIDTAEVCLDLSSLGETVVRHDLRKELLDRHAEPNPQHIENLKELGGIISPIDESEPKASSKVQKSIKRAHLDKDDFSTVFLSSVIDAGTLFVRLAKFEKVMDLLHNDIKEHVEQASELDLEELYVGNIILAEYPDDKTYERARIDAIIDKNKVECFFVDHGDRRQVSKKKLRHITDNILHRIPFQAIECRLVGIKPPGNAEIWPEFTTCWLEELCYEDNEAKYLYLKYFTKHETTTTGGHKYGVVLFDTSTEQDIIVNKKMLDLNLAKENNDESKYIDEPLIIKPDNISDSSSGEENAPVNNNIEKRNGNDLVTSDHFENNYMNQQASSILFEKPIRSIPLVNDSDSDDFDKWDVNVDKRLLGMFGQPSKANITEYKSDKDATDEERDTPPEKKIPAKEPQNDKPNDADVDTSTDKSKASISSSNCSQIENSKESSELVPKSPMLESQSDSDSVDIGTERMAALDIFKSKFINSDMIKKSLKNVDLCGIQTKKTVENVTKMYQNLNKPKKNDTLDSDDLSSTSFEFQNSEAVNTNVLKDTEIEPHRKPKLIWRQSKSSIIVKIMLIGVEDYVLDIGERHLTFHTWKNDTTYEFDFVLYGLVVPKKSVHSRKGQYIQVNLVKMLQRNWSNLTKDCSGKKWIVYDADAIDLSSEEEEEHNDALKAIKQNHERDESESEDEDFTDDLNLTYKKHL